MKRPYKSKPTNDHKKSTTTTSDDQGKADDKKFTSYDTTKTDTASAQKVKEETGSGGEQARLKKAKGE